MQCSDRWDQPVPQQKHAFFKWENTLQILYCFPRTWLCTSNKKIQFGNYRNIFFVVIRANHPVVYEDQVLVNEFTAFFVLSSEGKSCWRRWGIVNKNSSKCLEFTKINRFNALVNEYFRFYKFHYDFGGTVRIKRFAISFPEQEILARVCIT